MQLRQILNDPELKGITKGFIYYLEAKDHIKPLKTQRGQVERRDYSPSDLGVIKRMWAHHQAGIPPARAKKRLSVGLAEELPSLVAPKGLTAYIFLAPRPKIYQVPVKSLPIKKILRLLKDIAGVLYVACVYGPADFILKVQVDSLRSLHELVHRPINDVLREGQGQSRLQAISPNR